MNLDSYCEIVYQLVRSAFKSRSAASSKTEGASAQKVVMRFSSGLRFAVATVAAGAVVLSSVDAGAETPGEPSPALRRMRASECVELALRDNVDVRTSNEEVAASEAERAGVRGQLGPKLHADAAARRWTEAYTIPFSLDPTKPPSAFPVHDAFEWNASVTLTQPLTGLVAILEAYKVRDLGVDIATIRRDVARRDAAFHVVESYYRLLQGEQLMVVAKTSVEQLEGQLRQANSFHANGVVSQNDVLRAQLAVANAQQRVIQLGARVSLERSRLAILMGMPPDALIDAQPPGSEQLPRRDAETLAQAEQAAEVQRVELVELDKHIEQAHREARLAWLKIVPRVSAVGAYLHTEGSPFTQKNAAYVGAVASWDVWDWGTTSSAIPLANARERQAALARAKVNDQIRLEVRQAFIDIATASEAAAVSQASVAQAGENFRLVTKRYEANAATSFDVVDAEGLLTQARGQLQTAFYDHAVARAALRRAMGATPESIGRE
jgi:outer membrane protein TolC